MTPAVAFDNGVYQASAAQLLDLIRRASPEAGTLLVIGHDPAIPELALSLVSATAPVVAGVVRYAAPPAVLPHARKVPHRRRGDLRVHGSLASAKRWVSAADVVRDSPRIDDTAGIGHLYEPR
jgi:hypothetical protein